MTGFDFLLPLFTEYGYLAVFLMLLACGMGIPVPEDITLVTGGVIAGMGFADRTGMIFVGLLGVLLGDGIVFTAGRLFGDRVTRIPGFRFLMPQHRFALAQQKFERYGSRVIFLARFLPGLRTPILLMAGMTRRIRHRTWLLMDGSAALISVPAWVLIGYHGAENRDWLLRAVGSVQHALLGVVAAILIAAGVLLWRRHRASPPPSN